MLIWLRQKQRRELYDTCIFCSLYICQNMLLIFRHIVVSQNEIIHAPIKQSELSTLRNFCEDATYNIRVIQLKCRSMYSWKVLNWAHNDKYKSRLYVNCRFTICPVVLANKEKQDIFFEWKHLVLQKQTEKQNATTLLACLFSSIISHHRKLMVLEQIWGWIQDKNNQAT